VLSGVGQEQQSTRLVGGTATLVRALARDLPPEKILLGVCVTAATLAENWVALTIARTDRTSKRSPPPRSLPHCVSIGVGFPSSRFRANVERWKLHG